MLEKKYYKRGFSLTELLVAMLIFSIIAAATLPAMTSKKVKKVNRIVPHGIYECFYDENGKLMEYRVDNSRDGARNADPRAVEGTSCTLTPPPASYYKVQLIGAGGNGYDDPVKFGIEDDEEMAETGSILIEELDTANPPDWVRQNWGTQTIEISMQAPVGAGGIASCRSALQTGVNGCGDNTEPSEECTEELDHNGGDSGKGISIDSLDTSVNLGDNIQSIIDNDKVQLIYEEKSQLNITIFAAEAGGNASDTNNGTKGKDSTIIAQGLEYENDLQNFGGRCVNSEPTTPGGATSGSITFKPEQIEYSRQDQHIEVELGKNGTPGVIRDLILPNIGGRVLTLTPARNSKDVTRISIGGGLNFTASSGSDGNGIYTEKIEGIGAWDNETSPIGYLDEIDFEPQALSLGDLNNTGLDSYINNNDNITPGKAGTGSYPYITKFQYRPTIIVGENKVQDSILKPSTLRTLDDTISCKDGTNKTTKGLLGLLGLYYCKGTSGHPGAVRVIW